MTRTGTKHPLSAVQAATDHANRSQSNQVAKLLIGGELDVEIPSIAELTAAATSLALGSRRKVLLPLAAYPIEFALVRRDQRVLVSCYGTSNSPVVHQLDRSVSLRTMLDACAKEMLSIADHEADPTARQIAVRVAERALATDVVDAVDSSSEPINQRGGSVDDPGAVPLAFGYEASIYPSELAQSSRSTRADVHALLFEGTLWAFVRGRKVALARGPVLLAAHRMLMAVQSLLEALDENRANHVRLRAGAFQIALRLSSKQRVSIELSTDADSAIAASGLAIKEAALPILKLCSDLLRSLVAADRSQSRNLRVRALRQEVRSLRREIRSRSRTRGFINRDPDTLRIENRAPEEAIRTDGDKPTALRFDERWRISLPGLDANSVFMCGDRMVVVTPEHAVAVSRDSGDVLWARPGRATATLMASSVLIRLLSDGNVELCDVSTGEAYAHAHVTPRIGGPPIGIMAGGVRCPPVAVLTEGSHRLVAIDAHTGQPRWRFASRTGGEFQLKKFGRILLVTCGEEAIHALDIASGEDVWRFAEHGAFRYRPCVVGETVIALSSLGRRRSALFGLDLYSGSRVWQRELAGTPTTHPSIAGGSVLVAGVESDRSFLTALDVRTGEENWRTPDPGLGIGGAALCVDDLLLVNAPMGSLQGIDTATGQPRWHVDLANPMTDEIPRRLEPVLRGGALFVPASSVHVVRPVDGRELCNTLQCDLVPDLLRVDERGWIYIAEESGYLAAYAPKPVLTLLRGGQK